MSIIAVIESAFYVSDRTFEGSPPNRHFAMKMKMRLKMRGLMMKLSFLERHDCRIFPDEKGRDRENPRLKPGMKRRRESGRNG